MVKDMTFITAMSWKNGTGNTFLIMQSREWILWKIWRWKTLSCLTKVGGDGKYSKSCGFKEFEVLPLLWDEANPCQIYVMSLK